MPVIGIAHQQFELVLVCKVMHGVVSMTLDYGVESSVCTIPPLDPLPLFEMFDERNQIQIQDERNLDATHCAEGFLTDKWRSSCP